MTHNASNTCPPDHGFTVINDLRLHYLDFGGAGEPLLALHGITSNAWVWRDLAPQLPTRRLIALDARGHGDSQWSAQLEYTTADLTSDAISFIELMNLGPIDIMGGSWGGLVGLGIAAQRPDLVKTLTMVDIPPSMPGAEAIATFHPNSFATHAESVAYLKDSSKYMDDEIIEILATQGVRPGEDGRLYIKHDRYFDTNRPNKDRDHWDELASVRLPLLILRADDSIHLPLETAQRMEQVAQDGKMITISSTGHRIPTDNPVALGAVLKDFLVA